MLPTDPEDSPAGRLRLALELCDLAERMLRQRLVREHPGMPDAEVEELLDAWFLIRPGAEEGDSPGVKTTRAGWA